MQIELGLNNRSSHEIEQVLNQQSQGRSIYILFARSEDDRYELAGWGIRNPFISMSKRVYVHIMYKHLCYYSRAKRPPISRGDG